MRRSAMDAISQAAMAERVQRERHVLAVEVPAGDGVAVVREDDGVVGDGVHLAA